MSDTGDIRIKFRALKREIEVSIPKNIRAKMTLEEREEINATMFALANIFYDIAKR